MGFLNGEILGLPAAMVLIALGAMLVVVIVGVAIGMSSGKRQRVDKRVNAVVGRVGSGGEAKKANTGLRQRAESSGLPIIDAIARTVLPRPDLLRKRLRNTGRDIGVAHYLLVCVILTLTGIVGVKIALGMSTLLAAAVGVILGIGLPHMIIGIMVSKRRESFIGQFPDAIDLIVRGLKSGLPVSESIKTVGNEIPDPVGIEFKQIVDQLSLGKTLEEAMWMATERLDIAEFRFFVVSLTVQKETGGNLAETLENLADILRKRRQTKLKIRALSSEARASAMIIGCLPFIMFGLIWMVNSEYLLPLITDPRGNIMLGVGFLWLVLGFGIMAKMVRFEI
jgi:tight adherence protein B